MKGNVLRRSLEQILYKIEVHMKRSSQQKELDGDSSKSDLDFEGDLEVPREIEIQRDLESQENLGIQSNVENENYRM